MYFDLDNLEHAKHCLQKYVERTESCYEHLHRISMECRSLESAAEYDCSFSEKINAELHRLEEICEELTVILHQLAYVSVLGERTDMRIMQKLMEDSCYRPESVSLVKNRIEENTLVKIRN